MNGENGPLRPEARKDGLVVEELPEEVLVYDLERHEAHCLNQQAVWVWKHCDGESTVSEIAHRLAEEAKTPPNEDLVWYALAQLTKARLLAGEVRRPGKEMMSPSRRELLRRLGWAAAAALPLITSIAAPTPVQAASCLPSGSGCSSSAQCCSLNCAGGICT